MSLLLTLATILTFAHHWTPQSSGVKARLRGVSAVNARVAWASGSESTVLRTVDGGATWQKLQITTEGLDFRDIDAIDERTAYVLSIGNGPASRIYKTTDGGATWSLQFRNEDPKAFYDAMSFWDRDHGIVICDSIDGQFCILTTENGGRSWKRVPANVLPAALENEGAFAASGTNIAVFGKSHAWIATGAAKKARVLRTSDRGRTGHRRHAVFCRSIGRYLFDSFPRPEARRHSRRRLHKGADCYRQLGDNKRWRPHMDSRKRSVGLPIRGRVRASQFSRFLASR